MKYYMCKKMYCPFIIQFSQYDITLSASIVNILWYMLLYYTIF